MKMLYLVRHAEAANASEDHDRPLTETGRAVAAALGRLLARELAAPEMIISSDARRTRETVAGISAAFSQPVSTVFTHALYTAGARDLIEVIRAQGEASYDRLMLVGHNPAIGDLVRTLGTRGRAEAVAKAQRGHPPGGLAVLRLACHEWGDLWPGASELWRFITPADLDAQRPR